MRQSRVLAELLGSELVGRWLTTAHELAKTMRLVYTLTKIILKMQRSVFSSPHIKYGLHVHPLLVFRTSLTPQLCFLVDGLPN